jgi:hypothetical protein
MRTLYKIKWSDIEAASKFRLSGYIEEIIKIGVVHYENSIPVYVLLSDTQYNMLQSKYKQ